MWVILLYFVASVFIVIGFMLLFAFRRTRRWELIVLSFVYSGSGLAAGYSLQWWPLIAGFVVAWLLKFAGYDPDKPIESRVNGRSASDRPPGTG
ncbi:MAG: hypothetical protein IT531_17955 [Burkholderiales bacterium]|nr:hypothetical protein [Burkholderiales bacterium]